MFALLLSLMGVNGALAETLTTNLSTLPDGWSVVGATHGSDRARTGNAVYTSAKDAKANYLLTEELEGSISFYWRSYGTNSSYPNGQIILYKYADGAVGEQIAATTTMKSSTWTSASLSLGDYKGQVAIGLYSACIDDITYTQMEAVEGPALKVSGDTDGALNFGMVNPGATKTLTLSNPGTESITVNIATTGGFTANPTSATIAAGEQQTLTISAPEATATGKVTITPNPAVEGIAPVEIALSCVVKDPSKVFVDFSGNALPTAEGWEDYAESTSYAWSYDNGYASNTGGTYYKKYLASPAMIFEDGETLMFDAAGNSSWEPSYASYDNFLWRPDFLRLEVQHMAVVQRKCSCWNKVCALLCGQICQY